MPLSLLLSGVRRTERRVQTRTQLAADASTAQRRQRKGGFAVHAGCPWKGSLRMAFIVTILLVVLSWLRVFPEDRSSTLAWMDAASIMTMNLRPENSSLPIAHDKKNQQDKQNETIYFVHIGKAGGETIKGVLEIGCLSRRNRQRREACLSQLPDSQLSQSVRGYLHCFEQGRASIPPKLVSAFLFNVRHPLDRTISWFDYVHPKHCRLDAATRQNCFTKQLVDRVGTGDRSPVEGAERSWLARFFVDCRFETMQDWAQALEPVDETNLVYGSLPERCHDTARRSLIGGTFNLGGLQENPVAAHLIANMRINYRITSRKFVNKTVYVVRSESLWEDLQQLDVYLGGNGTFGEKFGHAVNQKPVSASTIPLSTRQIQLLCCALKLELIVYKTLIEKAKNLSPSSKSHTLESAMERCLFGSWPAFLSCDG